MQPAVKIRGIYATALSAFFLHRGARIVQPSAVIARRLGPRLGRATGSPNMPSVYIEDRSDHQGIELWGWRKHVELVERWLRENFRDAIFRPRSLLLPEMKGLEVEFPGWSKQLLDEWRARVVPTLPGHHRFRLINAARLEALEAQLAGQNQQALHLAEQFFQQHIASHLLPGARVRIEHVKPDGQLILLSPGKVKEFDRQRRRLVLFRGEFRGRSHYDGLGIPKEPGDYALSLLEEGAWFYRHFYFRKDGTYLGCFTNLNTPIELYGDRIRYVDLELDVVHWPDGTHRVVDEEAFAQYVQKGYFTDWLVAKTRRLAGELNRPLKEPWPEMEG